MDSQPQLLEYEPREPITSKKFANGYSWEMDAVGWHRIVSPSRKAGYWVIYESIAISHDGNFLCVSRYYGCPHEMADLNALPDILSETLYSITPIDKA